MSSILADLQQALKTRTSRLDSMLQELTTKIRHLEDKYESVNRKRSTMVLSCENLCMHLRQDIATTKASLDRDFIEFAQDLSRNLSIITDQHVSSCSTELQRRTNKNLKYMFAFERARHLLDRATSKDLNSTDRFHAYIDDLQFIQSEAEAPMQEALRRVEYLQEHLTTVGTFQLIRQSS